MSNISATAAPRPAPPSMAQKLAAEALGTFVLVFFGVGSVVMAGGRVLDLAGTALAFGISVTVMIYAVGRISGGHFNPAVSMGAALGGRVSWAEALLYMLVQVVAAIASTAVLFGIVHAYPGYDASGRMGANTFGHAGSGIAWWGALLLELVLTAIFVFVILAVTDTRNEHPALAPLAIGLTLVGAHLVGLVATGTSVNPARSIGPALFSGAEALKQLWVFVVAPFLGAAVSGLTYPLLFGRDVDPVAGSGLRRGARAGAVPGYGAPDQLQQQWQQGSPGQDWQGQQYPPQQPQIGHTQPAAPPAWNQPPPAAPPAVPPASSGWPPPAPGPDDPDDGRTQIRPQQ